MTDALSPASPAYPPILDKLVRFDIDDAAREAVFAAIVADLSISSDDIVRFIDTASYFGDRTQGEHELSVGYMTDVMVGEVWRRRPADVGFYEHALLVCRLAVKLEREGYEEIVCNVLEQHAAEMFTVLTSLERISIAIVILTEEARVDDDDASSCGTSSMMYAMLEDMPCSSRPAKLPHDVLLCLRGNDFLLSEHAALLQMLRTALLQEQEE